MPQPLYLAELAITKPFVPQVVHQTVLKLLDSSFQPPSRSIPAIDQPTTAAMQQLAAIIQTLRTRAYDRSPLTPPISASGATHSGYTNLLQVPEMLLPYVSEEAYDVWDAVQNQKHQPSPPQTDDSIMTIETLIPHLLWSVARSAYNVMHLIEGIRAQCWQPEQGWASGMVRLALLLEAEAPAMRWQFDLATGYPPATLLEASAIIQSDEQALPIKHTSTVADEAACSTVSPNVEHQLQAVLQMLNGASVGSFFNGVTVALLQPGAEWQTGILRLKLGFEFIAHATADLDRSAARSHPELVEAELMDETALERPPVHLPGATIAPSSVKPQVSLVESVRRSLSPATLVRVTDAPTLDRYTQAVIQNHWAKTLHNLHQQPADNANAPLLAIVQAAIATVVDPHAVDSYLGLLQPMLLMDELVPKLLWCLTSSTYEIMQLLGGVPVRVLQPGLDWQQGTLRLLAMLQIKIASAHYTIDLSTGQLVTAETLLKESAIVQSNATALCQQPTQVAALAASLCQQICDRAPGCELLMQPIAIEWLEETDQDWQPGTLQLSFDVTLSPALP